MLIQRTHLQPGIHLNQSAAVSAPVHFYRDRRDDYYDDDYDDDYPRRRRRRYDDDYDDHYRRRRGYRGGRGPDGEGCVVALFILGGLILLTFKDCKGPVSGDNRTMTTPQEHHTTVVQEPPKESQSPPYKSVAQQVYEQDAAYRQQNLMPDVSEGTTSVADQSAGNGTAPTWIVQCAYAPGALQDATYADIYREAKENIQKCNTSGGVFEKTVNGVPGVAVYLGPFQSKERASYVIRFYGLKKALILPAAGYELLEVK